MVATKEKTEVVESVVTLDQITEDIRKQYEAGSATQAELAASFEVSVSAINKIVNGVHPAKRKYHRNEAKLQRNVELVKEYNSGVEVKELASKYEMTHQNVSLILKEAGIVPQSSYIAKLKKQGAATKAAKDAAKVSKRQEKLEAVEKLSQLWISGCSVEEFRAAAGLKSVNSAQVKLVLLRKAHGEVKFPRRNRRAGEVEAVEAPSAVEEVVEQETQEDVEFVAEEVAENK